MEFRKNEYEGFFFVSIQIRKNSFQAPINLL